MAVSTLQRALLTELKAMAVTLKDDWDYPPVIGSIHILGDGLNIEPWPIPSDLWSKIPPPKTMYYIAEKMAQVPELARKATDGAIAIFFCCEGWSVPPEMNDEPEVRKARREHAFHTLDARIEVRMISAMDKDGNTYFVQLNRGDEEANGSVEQADPDPDQPVVGGMVFDALDKLAALLMGTERRERQTHIKTEEEEGDG